MTIDNEKLKPCPFCGGRVQLEEVKMRSGTWYGVKCRNTRNLGGDCTMEQVPSRTPEAAAGRWNMRKPMDDLEAEIERLREANDKLSRRNGMLEENVQTMTEAYVLYTWLRKKVDQPSNDQVAVTMNIGHDWVIVHDLDRDLRTMIDQEEP